MISTMAIDSGNIRSGILRSNLTALWPANAPVQIDST